MHCVPNGCSMALAPPRDIFHISDVDSGSKSDRSYRSRSDTTWLLANLVGVKGSGAVTYRQSLWSPSEKTFLEVGILDLTATLPVVDYLDHVDVFCRSIVCEGLSSCCWPEPWYRVFELLC